MYFILDQCRCGGPFSTTRIIGGAEVTPHTFPYQVALSIGSTSTNLFCSGSLISPIYVLTAAHCILGRNISTIFAVVGEHNINAPGDGEQYISIQTALIHPRYNESETWSNNFAILRLSRNVTLPSSTAGLVCLPSQATLDVSGVDLVFSGWGQNVSYTSYSPVLKATNMVGVSPSECQQNYGPYTITPYHVCATGSSTQSSTCFGDGGGKS